MAIHKEEYMGQTFEKSFAGKASLKRFIKIQNGTLEINFPRERPSYKLFYY